MFFPTQTNGAERKNPVGNKANMKAFACSFSDYASLNPSLPFQLHPKKEEIKAVDEIELYSVLTRRNRPYWNTSNTASNSKNVYADIFFSPFTAFPAVLGSRFLSLKMPYMR